MKNLAFGHCIYTRWNRRQPGLSGIMVSVANVFVHIVQKVSINFSLVLLYLHNDLSVLFYYLFVFYRYHHFDNALRWRKRGEQPLLKLHQLVSSLVEVVYFLCCGSIMYTHAPPHIVQGTLLPAFCPLWLKWISFAFSGSIDRDSCFSQLSVLLASVISMSHFIAFSLIFTKSPACAAILYAIPILHSLI